MEAIIVYITIGDETAAVEMAGTLVKERLAACVNIVRNVRSIYRWDGEVHDESESLMIIKTQKYLFEPLKSRVNALHTYSVPEVIAVSVVDGTENYLDWLKENTA